MNVSDRGILRILAAALSFMLILPAAHARMYQWEQTESGRIQLSGQAPAWYRSAHAGPRILVFDNGKLIDDTAVAVSEVHRQFLRQQALGTEAHDEPLHTEPLDQESVLREALTEAAKAGLDVEELASNAKQVVAEEQALLGGGLEEKVNELKALLSRWDAARTDEARAVVDSEDARNNPP